MNREQQAIGRHRVPRTRARWRLRATVGVSTVGLAAIGAGIAGMTTAHAAAAPGSNFGNVNIAATAAGVRVPFYSHAGEDVEGDIPEAQSVLQSGGVGRASTSVFWPGGTGAAGGDTLYILLNGNCLPPNPNGVIPVPLPCPTTVPNLPPGVYQSLDDPYVAKAQTGAGKPTSTTTGPGVKMTATATQTNISASSTMDASAVPNVGNQFGSTSAATSILVTGANTAKVTATSVMHNISLGGGVVKIDSITSVTAMTNAKTGAGTAKTTVQGMTLAGTPVVVDNKGLHLASQHAGLPSLDAVNKALAQSGFEVFVAAPTHLIHGPTVDVNSGNLVVMQTNAQYAGQANDSGVILTLGGASIHADSSLGYGSYVPPPPPPIAPPPASSGGGTTVPAAGGTTTTAGGGGLPPAPAVAGQQPPAQTPVLASQQTALPGGIKPVWVVLVLLGSGLVAAGLRRLPDDVLRSRGSACTLGQQ